MSLSGPALAWGIAGGLTVLLMFSLWRVLRASARANLVDWGGRGWNLLDGFNRLFCHRFHRLRHEPVMLPESGPAVVVANHCSGLDPLLMLAASNRPLRFMIAREQYERFGLRWLFRGIGCIPVERERSPEKAFRAALRALRDGEVVALFPHGRIRLDSDPPVKLKPGAVRLAHLAKCPVYPLRIEGVAGQGHTVLAVFIRSRARLRRLATIDCAERDNRACIAEIADAIEGRAS